ncbi:MAG: hypothetical protein ABSC56_06535 [Solirubrobacteraceae bacterium]|jgi:hypothetical protein
MLYRRAAVLLCAATALLIPEAAGAAVTTPPADTPNLALMVLQPADLQPGVRIGAQNYVTPPPGFTAEYGSALTGATSTSGTKYRLIQDYVALAPSATVANGFYTEQRAAFTSHSGRRALVRALIKEVGKNADLRSRNFKFGQATSPGVGSSSFAETLTIKVKHRSVTQVLLAFADGDVYVGLALEAPPGEPIPASDPIALATAIDAHVHTVTAATGATGSTGPSGST